MPGEAIELAIEDLTRDRGALSSGHANREIYRLLKDGVKVKMRGEGGKRKAGRHGTEIDETVRVIDWNIPDKAMLPDATANEFTGTAALFVTLAREIRALEPEADIGAIMDGVEQLLDISIASRGYVIRESSGAYTSGTGSSIDLSRVDFDALKAHFERSRKHIEAEKLRGAIASKLKRMLQLNKSRVNYQERFQQMIDDYNAGSANVELFFEELVKFVKDLNQEEQRHVAERLSEEELAMFDLLARPNLTLSEKEQEQIKKVVRDLLIALKREKLVLDWRKKQQACAEVRLTVENALDTGLPESYTPALYQRKCAEVFQHIYDSYFGQGQSIYTAA